jgi:hypothetical protein
MEELRITFKDGLANALHRLALDRSLNWAEEESRLADQCGGLYSRKAVRAEEESHLANQCGGLYSRKAGRAEGVEETTAAEDHRVAEDHHLLPPQIREQIMVEDHRAAVEITAVVGHRLPPQIQEQIMVEATTATAPPRTRERLMVEITTSLDLYHRIRT